MQLSKSTPLLLLILAYAAMAFFTSPPKQHSTDEAPLLLLSDYGFFKNSIKDLEPEDGVMAYEVNAALFSDYAEKSRFFKLPGSQKMVYNSDSAFVFPEGSHLIKNFHYPTASGRRLIETRILKKTATSWKAYTYVWNTEQTDATLEVAGATIPVDWLDEKGKTRHLDYLVPNLNQCKGCHSQNGNFVPIGLRASQINRWNATYHQNQLQVFFDANLDTLAAPKMPNYTDLSAPLADRARAYLDANCAYCHNAAGPASTSGLYLNYTEQAADRLGINKSPVAAGRGSGGRKYGIAPGAPKESILLFRMESTDTGIRMPEIGRSVVDVGGVELIRTWIEKM